ncbi:hypothetical protein LX32DRAFT_227370 [Colletotrichum zoysiae]|uniref:Uncharacterized protein n=1 Tax=Colletotrichum zoysiae TaxID=1216348 RepID=A0AAD9M3U8_9PEZI|nr:hypothetical protein LX32DRAFT_227370 [Colletotrichum zoysiae]
MPLLDDLRYFVQDGEAAKPAAKSAAKPAAKANILPPAPAGNGSLPASSLPPSLTHSLPPTPLLQGSRCSQSKRTCPPTSSGSVHYGYQEKTQAKQGPLTLLISLEHTKNRDRCRPCLVPSASVGAKPRTVT